MEELDYYSDVLKSVDKKSHTRGESSNWRIFDKKKEPKPGSFMYVPSQKEAIGENARRYRTADLIQNILYEAAKKKLPENIRVGNIKQEDGSYRLHAEFNDSNKVATPLKLEDLVDDTAGINVHNVDSIAGTKESTMSTEGLGEMLLFREKSSSGFYPPSPNHPRFPQLSPTSQKLTKLQFEHREARNKVNRKVKKIMRNM